MGPLFATAKDLDFKAHPLVPCVVVMHENLHGKAESLSCLICVGKDDLRGGGVGHKYQAAIEVLRKECNFGKWKILMDTSTEYGGRTLKQLPDSLFKVSMTRYLKDEATESKIACGRSKDLKAPADGDHSD